MKVVKFGGSSLSNAAGFIRCRDIVFTDRERKVIVASAPGKRNKGDCKVTDLLYLAAAYNEYGFSITPIINKVKKRFSEIVRGLNLDFNLEKEFDEFLSVYRGDSSTDYLVSRGEYLCAKIFAKLIGAAFIDAKDLFITDRTGTVDEIKTAKNLSLIKENTPCVIGGFYGGYNGGVKLFERGGGDNSGAYLAKLLPTDTYEIFTDVSGIMRVNPKIVKRARYIDRLTFKELDLLRHLKASVLNQAVVGILSGNGVRLAIKKTFKPSDKGTLIVDGDTPLNAVTGIGLDKGYICVNVSLKKSKADNMCIGAFNDWLKSVVGGVEELTFTDNTATIILQEKKHAHLIEDFLGVIKSNNLVKGCVVKRDLAVLTVVGYAVDKTPSFLPRLFSTLSKIGASTVAINKIAGEAKISVYLDKNIAEEAVKRLNSVLFKPLT